MEPYIARKTESSDLIYATGQACSKMISTENTKKIEVNVEITKPQTSQYVNTERKPLVSLYIQFFGIIVYLYIQMECCESRRVIRFRLFPYR